jgi:hypothetical protein
MTLEKEGLRDTSVHESGHAITFDALGEQVQRVSILPLESGEQQLEGHTLLSGGVEKKRPVLTGIAGTLAGPAASLYLCQFPNGPTAVSAFRSDQLSLKSLFTQQESCQEWSHFWLRLQRFLQSWEQHWVIANREVIFRFAEQLEELKSLESNELRDALAIAWQGNKPNSERLKDEIRCAWNALDHV